MTYRDDVEAHRHRVQSLEGDARSTAQQLAEARRLLEDAQRKSRLPVLDNLHVAAPCKASWNDMVGDDRARFCGQCEKNVYNLSAMSRPEAEALLLEKEGRLCVRYYQRADGTILTADCPDGLRRRRRRKRVVAAAFGAMSALVAAGTMSGSAKTGAPIRPVTEQQPPSVAPTPEPLVMGEPVAMPVMGRVSAPRPPAETRFATMGAIAFKPEAAKPTDKQHHKKR